LNFLWGGVGSSRRRNLDGAGCPPWFGDRQGHPEGSSLTGLAFHGHVPAVGLHDGPHDRQTKAGAHAAAGAGFIPLVKALPDQGQIVRRDAWSGIGHRYFYQPAALRGSCQVDLPAGRRGL